MKIYQYYLSVDFRYGVPVLMTDISVILYLYWYCTVPNIKKSTTKGGNTYRLWDGWINIKLYFRLLY